LQIFTYREGSLNAVSESWRSLIRCVLCRKRKLLVQKGIQGHMTCFETCFGVGAHCRISADGTGTDWSSDNAVCFEFIILKWKMASMQRKTTDWNKLVRTSIDTRHL